MFKMPKDDYLIEDRYLLKGIRLCILKCGTLELLIRKIHGGSLAGHFRKTRPL